MLRSYRDLIVWQKAMRLVVQSYRLTKLFPTDERYGLTSQIRRAAVSVPANIAEGFGRHHLGDYLRHLSIANGSLFELETELLCSELLGYVASAKTGEVLHGTAEVGRMLAGLTRKLRQRRF